MTSGVELLSPAGDFDTALAAFSAGADAVYCGLADFSARAFAKNFSFEDLENLISYARANSKKVYVTFNTLIDEDNLEAAIEQLARLEEIGPDALIIQDLGVAAVCRKHFPGLKLHASTQLVAHNLEGVLALGELGFERVVLARELSIAEIASIAKRCRGIELETFIHGALCYSISGLCLFSAMEKGRSGNRGKCAYCCRLDYDREDGSRTLAFSMKDLRAGEDARKLVEAGACSLKIEGRMKSPLYVASVTKYYREILDGVKPTVSTGDLETVFSRRTTKLYLEGETKDRAIDPNSLGHLGTPIGTVKRVTKDRDGLSWLRFHTTRALEKHDGLQFENPEGGKPLGMGINEMRQAISRVPVFEVAAGADVEVLLSEELGEELKPGMKIYCSMSNAVKRRFPVPSFRPSDYPGGKAVDVEVEIKRDRITANGVTIECRLEPANNPDKTFAAVEKAFSRLGGTGYRLGKLDVVDEDRLFAPMSVLNDLRRDLTETMDEERESRRRAKIDAALDSVGGSAGSSDDRVSGKTVKKVVKITAGQRVPAGEWDEVVVIMGEGGDRVALPVYTAEPDFGKLRIAVKNLIRKGYRRWEAADLAGLRMLKELGIDDITADWTLYAFNSASLRALAELGVKRFVASPENGRDNLQYLAESGYSVEFLVQQSTPLFISITEPEHQDELAVYERGGLYVTTKRVPRTFSVPEGVAERVDLSWDPE